MEIQFNPTVSKLEPPRPEGAAVLGELEKDSIYTFSGKSALSILLRYYRSTNALRDRTDELLVPQWLGLPVYEGIHRYCFPTTSYNERVRGVLVYHQWGYPQRMDVIQQYCKDKNLFLIEDCAHSLESRWNSKRVGTIGDVSFFSLAKFFPTVMGGAIYTTSLDIQNFVRNIFKEDNPSLAQEFFDTRLAFDQEPSERNRIELEKSYIVCDKALQCPDYSLALARQEVADGALEARKRNYMQYAGAFGTEKYLSQLLKETVVPWVVPLFFEEETCKKVATALQAQGIESGVYHFDVNRNMLDPQFVPCVPVPCHHHMSEEDIKKIIAIVQKASA